MKRPRLLSSCLAFSMLLSVLMPVIPVSAEEAEPDIQPTVQSDIEITGSSPLGDMIVDKLTEEQSALDAQNGCGIYDVQLSDTQAYIKFSTTLDCTLLLTLFDDSGETLLTSAETEVTTEDTSALLDVENMPESCYLRACLIDTETLSPISATYSSGLYTQEMQEFLSKTTDDFDPDLVMNLDDDNTKNFMVLDENLICIDSTESENTAVFDGETQTITLSSCDESALSLTAGQTFLLDTGEQSMLFKAAAVEQDGDSICITVEQAKLEDLFAFVNLEFSAENMQVNDETTDETLSQNRPVQHLPQIDAGLAGETIPLGSFPFGDQSLTPNNDSGETAAKGTADLTITPTGHLYMAGLYAEASLDLDLNAVIKDFLMFAHGRQEFKLAKLSLSFDFDINDQGMQGSGGADLSGSKGGKLGKALKYMRGDFPTSAGISLIDIYLSENLVIEGNCTVSGTCEFELDSIIGMNSIEGLTQTTSMPKLISADLEAEGSFSLGPSINYGVDLITMPMIKGVPLDFNDDGSFNFPSLGDLLSVWEIEEKTFFKVSQKNPILYEFTARTAQPVSGDRSDMIHTCEQCYEGEITYIFETTNSLESDIFPDISTDNTTPNYTRKLGDWYKSVSYGTHGMTPCPYHYYKVEIEVRDGENNKLPDATVTCLTSGAAYNDELTAVTDENGIATLYLNSGVRYFKAEKDGFVTGSGIVRVEKAPRQSEIVLDGVQSRGSQNIYRMTAGNSAAYTGEADANACVTVDGVIYQLYDDHAEVSGSTSDCPSTVKLYANVNGLPVTSIGEYAFFSATKTSLTSITIPNSVTSIGRAAFAGCTKLTSIIIPNSVTSIGERAFSSCTHMTSITIPNSVMSIGDYAFSDCLSLTSITIPHNVTSIGTGVFAGCTSLTTITIPGSVTSIGDHAFERCTSLPSINIPNSVTNIGEYAFYQCESLKSITIPDSVTSIEDYVFYVCTSLTSVIIPDSVTSIGISAFYDCKSLPSITIPGSVTSIGNGAFSGCTNLPSITIPDSVNSIGNGAFNGCTSLAEIKVDEDNQSYCEIDGNLYDKSQAKLIQYAIGKEAVNFTIPDSVTNIGDFAFYDCTSLKSIIIPDSVTSIGSWAFGCCTNLPSITIPNSVKSIGRAAFSGCTSLPSIIIPDSITSIGESEFNGCTSLKSITIPNSVLGIGSAAFSGCTSLTSITIPDSVKNISNGAFYDCTSLTDVYYTGTEEQWNTITIGKSNDPLSSAVIHYNSTAPAAAKPRPLAAQIIPTETTSTLTEATTTTTATIETTVETTTVPSRDETDLTALTPNTVYNLYALSNRKNGVSSGNLLWFAQAVSDENGAVSVGYEGEVFAVKAMVNLTGAEVTMPEFTYDGTEKEVFPTVTLNGKQLEEGKDYLVSGSYTGTSGGTYSILIEGTGDYFGAINAEFVIDGKETATLSGDVNLDGEVSVADAVLLMRLVSEDSDVPIAYSWANADVDADGLISIMDVSALLRMLSV